MDFEITPEFLDVIAYIESRGNPAAINTRTGALGAYQFMPIAWQDVSQNVPQLAQYQDYKKYAVDPDVSRKFAESYFNILTKRLKGQATFENLIASYNWGLGNLKKYGLSEAPEETKKYISDAKKYMEQGLPSKSHYRR